jgi:hypothetical protein
MGPGLYGYQIDRLVVGETGDSFLSQHVLKTLG